MIRCATLCCLLVMSAGLALVGAAPGTKAEDKRPVTLAARLKQTIDFKGFQADPKMVLDNALDQLAEDYGLQFEVNEAAFKSEMVEDVGSKPVAERTLPKMGNVRLEAVLRKLLARVPSVSGTTFVARRDAIEITTMGSLVHEIWGDNYKGPFLPLVNQNFDNRPLEEALKDLAAVNDFNIVLDSRVADKAKTAVSARFENTPLDTAVRLLADMADLKPFVVDNVLYVTSPARADQMEAREKQKMEQDDAAQSGPRVGQGRWLFRPGNAPGM
jgi:hypothetical protein